MTATTTQQIEEIDQQNKILDAKYRELDQARQTLMQRHDELIIQFVRESRLLQGTKWRIDITRTSYADMVLIPYSVHIQPEMESLIKLLRTDWHCSIELQEGVSLRFDDNDISLNFKNSSLVVPFIQQHGIVVITLDLRDKIDKLKKDIIALEEVLKMVGATNV
jgi:hypothetical protein